MKKGHQIVNALFGTFVDLPNRNIVNVLKKRFGRLQREDTLAERGAARFVGWGASTLAWELCDQREILDERSRAATSHLPTHSAHLAASLCIPVLSTRG